ncbi:hypothetical protein Q4X04_004018 [Salmonella enterica]|nr:hypothetical protein [Salmonella enterica]
MNNKNPYHKSFYYSFFISFFFVFTFLFEGYEKYERYYYDAQPSSLARLTIVATCFLIFILQIGRRHVLYTSISLLLISIWFCVGYAIGDENSLDPLYVMMKYISGIVVLGGVLLSGNKRLIGNVFFYLFIINCIISWSAFMFDIEWIRTYAHIKSPDGSWHDERFGYNGLILEQNVSTYFYIAGIYATYWQVRFNGKSNIYWIITLPSIMIVGTKSVFIAFALAPVLFLFRDSTTKSVIFFIFSFIATILLVQSGVLNYDIANNIFSFRPHNFNERLVPLLSNYSIFDLFFGMQIANYEKYLTEFEIVDLISFMGPILSALYVWTFFFVVTHNIKGIYLNESAYNLIFTCFVTCLMSGHLFYDPISMIYLSVALCGAFCCGNNNSSRVELCKIDKS